MAENKKDSHTNRHITEDDIQHRKQQTDQCEPNADCCQYQVHCTGKHIQPTSDIRNVVHGSKHKMINIFL